MSDHTLILMVTFELHLIVVMSGMTLFFLDMKLNDGKVWKEMEGLRKEQRERRVIHEQNYDKWFVVVVTAIIAGGMLYRAHNHTLKSAFVDLWVAFKTASPYMLLGFLAFCLVADVLASRSPKVKAWFEE